MNKKLPNDSTKLAGRTFDTSDYEKNDTLSNGLATTHEQVSDTYTEGEIGAVIDDVNREDIPLNKTNTQK
ncbi:MAG: YozQ family protein [Bacillota bacterium]|nr:YozQ family protein [Bacillota bacterium]